MKFAEPLWLLAGVSACAALLWMWRRYDLRQRKALDQFASSHLHAELTKSISFAKRHWKRGLLLGAIACLFAALARPQAGFRWEEVKRRGIEVVFAVDTSKSMLTPDVKPNRLTRAKLAVDDFVSHLNGDGVGLIAFAGNAFLQCPITLDYDAFRESLNALDTNIIPRGGTDIASAIQETQTALQNRAGSDKILVLLTDGEDLEGNALTAAKAAAKEGLKIYTLGVGSTSGELIPISAEEGGGFVKDDAGQFVKSRLDEPGLKAIADATGGRYAALGAQGEGLETIYKEALAPLAKHDLASRQQKIYTERYQWPLGAALAAVGQFVGWHTASSCAKRGCSDRSSRAAKVRVARGRCPDSCHAFRVICARGGLRRERRKSVQERRLRDGSKRVCSGGEERAEAICPGVQRRHGGVQSETISTGRGGISEIAQRRTVRRSQAPRRTRGRVLQPRKHTLSRWAGYRKERPQANDSEMGGSGQDV